MKKMNRRDYLIGMSAAASVVASAGKFNVSAQDHHEVPEAGNAKQKRSKDDSKSATSKIFEKSGLHKYDLHSTESVKLIFSGLMSFSRNGSRCLVGFYSKENSKHRHHLGIKVFKKEGGSCQLISSIMVLPTDPMTLEIVMPDVLNGVYYFQPPQSASGQHDNDFRWVPNLEGPDWYNRPLTIKAGIYAPILEVSQGLFYTLKKTASTFRRQKPDGSDVLEIENVAQYIGTNIYLKPGGSVKLTVNRQVVVLPQLANVMYEIQFDNHCRNFLDTEDCQFRPYHMTDRTERSDFYMNFDALDNVSQDSELHLIIAKRGAATMPDICRGTRASDESPCAGVGYGGTGGFPTFP